MNPEQMAQLQMMMGGAKKPEPWTKMGVAKALAGFTIASAAAIYFWDARGAPLERVQAVKASLNAWGYTVSAFPIAIPLINDLTHMSGN